MATWYREIIYAIVEIATAVCRQARQPAAAISIWLLIYSCIDCAWRHRLMIDRKLVNQCVLRHEK